jgi:hypothetical protein
MGVKREKRLFPDFVAAKTLPNFSFKPWSQTTISSIGFGFRTWTLSMPNLFLEERRLIMDFAISHTPAEIWHSEPCALANGGPHRR